MKKYFSRKPPRLLLIEDNPLALKVVESIAKAARCNYLSAITGRQAMELLNHNDFDLILSDIGLPDISGIELTNFVRDKEKNSGRVPVPIIGLTAHVANLAQDEALKAGMNKVLGKPMNLMMMKEILGHYLG